jgi:hypothetical protein
VQAAPPGLPAAFYGGVALDDGEPHGALISARIDGETFAQATVQQDPSFGSVYLLNVPADDPDTPAVEGGDPGDTVDFLIHLPGGRTYEADESAAWGRGSLTALDLSFSSGSDLFLPLLTVGS